jgi:uncharacterized membrane protein
MDGGTLERHGEGHREEELSEREPQGGRSSCARDPRVNVGGNERVLSAVLGALLVGRGLRRRSLGGLLISAAGGGLVYRGVTGRCGVYERLGMSSNRPRWRDAGAPPDAIDLRSAITIQRPAHELHEMWRDPRTLSRIVGELAEIVPVEDEQLEWRVTGPFGVRRTWRTRTVASRPGESVGWQSLPGAALPNEGRLRFRAAPGGRGTECELQVRFEPPGGAAGHAVARMLGSTPKLLFTHALRRLKSLAETGEIPTTAHEPSARPVRRNAARERDGRQGKRAPSEAHVRSYTVPAS